MSFLIPKSYKYDIILQAYKIVDDINVIYCFAMKSHELCPVNV